MEVISSPPVTAAVSFIRSSNGSGNLRLIINQIKRLMRTGLHAGGTLLTEVTQVTFDRHGLLPDIPRQQGELLLVTQFAQEHRVGFERRVEERIVAQIKFQPGHRCTARQNIPKRTSQCAHLAPDA